MQPGFFKERLEMFTKERTNICKGAAILMLLFHHLFSDGNIDDYGIRFLMPDDIGAAVAEAMRVCVRLFIFLSAYGLTYKYMRRPGTQTGAAFAGRQWFSLMKLWLPIYLLILAVYAATGHSIMGKYLGSRRYLLLDALALSDFFDTPRLLGVFWYMCFAQVLILAIPLLSEICKKLGYLAIPLTFLLHAFISGGIKSDFGGTYHNYLLAVVCGCVFAQKDTLNILFAKKRRALTAVLAGLFCGAAACACLYLKAGMNNDNDLRDLRFVLDTAAAVLICLFFGVYLRVPVLTRVLELLGRYSGSMFLLHVMFYGLLDRFVWVSRHAAVVWLVLVAESLAAAWLLETCKKYSGYNRGMSALYAKAEGAAIAYLSPAPEAADAENSLSKSKRKNSISSE